MKKLIAILLVALMAASLFAAVDFDPATLGDAVYSKVMRPFQPTDPRSLGMGGAGLALTESASSMFSNPASMAGGNAAVSIPSVGVTVNNVYALVSKDEDGNSAIDKVMAELEKEEISISNIVTELVNVMGSDHGEIASVDASLAIRLKGGFGLGAFVKDTVRTYSTSGALASNVVNQINLNAFLGYGFGLDLGIAKINVGASAKVNYLAFNKAANASDLLSVMGEDGAFEEFLNSYPVVYGYSMPVSVGAGIEFPFGLKATAVIADMNNKFQFNVAEAYNLSEEPALSGIEFEIDPTMNVGVAFTTPGFIKATLAADLMDVSGYVKDLSDGIESDRALLTHLNAGAEIDILNLAEARVGISQGYMSVGASFNFLVFRVDAAYYWKEMGATTGQRPLDALSLRFNLGWEK